MKTRDPYFDNLKAILIFLVVLGHFTHLNRSSSFLMMAVNNVIYSFHMPMFIFVSGYFSKKIKSQRISEIETILYPFFVFQIVYLFFTKFTGLGSGSKHIFDPVYQNWYLLGLFIWRLLIPYFSLSANKKFSLFCAIIFSLAIGFFSELNVLELYRILYFFPMFILGYYCSDIKVLINKYSKYKYYFIGISLLSLALIFLLSFFYPNIGNRIAFAYIPSSDYKLSFLNFLLRLIGFFSSLVISFGLLFMIPQNKIRFLNFGENTMYIFLLHMFFVYPINHYLGKNMLNVPDYLIFLIFIVLSILISIVCSNMIITKILSPFIDLNKMKLLIKNYR